MTRKANAVPAYRPPPPPAGCLSTIEKRALQDIRDGVLNTQGLPFLSRDEALTYALTLACAVGVSGRAAEFAGPPLSLHDILSGA